MRPQHSAQLVDCGNSMIVVMGGERRRVGWLWSRKFCRHWDFSNVDQRLLSSLWAIPLYLVTLSISFSAIFHFSASFYDKDRDGKLACLLHLMVIEQSWTLGLEANLPGGVSEGSRYKWKAVHIAGDISSLAQARPSPFLRKSCSAFGWVQQLLRAKPQFIFFSRKIHKWLWLSHLSSQHVWFCASSNQAGGLDP